MTDLISYEKVMATLAHYLKIINQIYDDIIIASLGSVAARIQSTKEINDVSIEEVDTRILGMLARTLLKHS